MITGVDSLSRDTEGTHPSTVTFYLEKRLHTIEIAFESSSKVANDFA